MSRRNPTRTVLQAGPPVSSAGGMAEVARTIDEGLRSTDLGYTSVVVNSGGGLGKKGYRAFPVALARVGTARFDVLHLHVASKGSVLRKMALAEIARARRRPFVIHLHGGGFDDFLASLSDHRRAVVARFFHSAAHTVVLGGYWRRLLVDRLDLPAASVSIVPNGVPAGPPPLPPEKRDRSIVFVGGVTRAKGIDVLLDAVEASLDDGRWQGWSVHLVGPAPDQALKARVADIATRSPGRVELLGPVFGHEKSQLLSRAGVFVLPSRKEGMPLVVLEAMSRGVPCVATAVGSVCEVIDDGTHGIIVEPGDAGALRAALTTLIVDDERRAAIGSAGHQRWLEEFTDEVMLRRLAAVWDGVCPSR